MYTEEDLKCLSNAQLHSILTDMQEATGGNKSELQERILADFAIPREHEKIVAKDKTRRERDNGLITDGSSMAD
ncbi:hypothetical protein BV898_06041 [Hypsibius exemplaris]|uniref:SAP domain-containing protein n=1 Tax=Hypsibius exemplaris TaxID=2072580 RepID=A0A1W0WXX1_HYPEX|nr:hypothetical protein BV898_06041 [Hypsibius exemplaris]